MCVVMILDGMGLESGVHEKNHYLGLPVPRQELNEVYLSRVPPSLVAATAVFL